MDDVMDEFRTVVAMWSNNDHCHLSLVKGDGWAVVLDDANWTAACVRNRSQARKLRLLYDPDLEDDDEPVGPLTG